MNSASFPFYFIAISSKDTKSKPQICTWHSAKGAGIWSLKTSSTSISDWFLWNLWLFSVSYNWVTKTWSKEHQTHFSSSPKGTQWSVTITKSGQEWSSIDCRSAHWSDPSFSFREKTSDWRIYFAGFNTSRSKTSICAILWNSYM